MHGEPILTPLQADHALNFGKRIMSAVAPFASLVCPGLNRPAVHAAHSTFKTMTGTKTDGVAVML